METRDNNNDFQQFDKIEKFLLNKFSDHEQQKFEDELKQNKYLNEEVEQVRILIQAIEWFGMREKIGQFHEKTV